MAFGSSGASISARLLHPFWVPGFLSNPKCLSLAWTCGREAHSDLRGCDLGGNSPGKVPLIHCRHHLGKKMMGVRNKETEPPSGSLFFLTLLYHARSARSPPSVPMDQLAGFVLVASWEKKLPLWVMHLFLSLLLATVGGGEGSTCI